MRLIKIYSYCLIILMISACSTPRTYYPSRNNYPHYQSNQPTPDGYYRVKSGDNLYRIGLRYNLSVSTLSELNQLDNSDQIEVGQLLRIRATSGSPTQVSEKSPVIPSNPKPNIQEKASSSSLKNLHLIWPNSGKITAFFDGKNQKGINISNHAGSPVVAAAQGSVAYAGDKVRGYGNLVLIRHSKNILTAYAHNQSIAVKQGQKVKKGQKIATIGSSGAHQPQLHFELRLNGKAVNPIPYLPAR